MKADDPRLLAAFRLELNDCLEALRAQFDRWRQEAPESRPASVKELRRLAHTVKGSGRILGLTTCFELGRRLESAFQHLATQHPDSVGGLAELVPQALDLLRVVHQRLGAGPADVDHAACAAALDVWLAQTSSGPPAAPAAPNGPVASSTAAPARPHDRLLRAFRAEAPEHIGAIRTACAELAQAGPDTQRPWIDTAHRAAHNLKGAARAVDLPDIVQQAHALEDLLTALTEQHRAVGPDSLAEIRQGADKLEVLCHSILHPTEPAPAHAEPRPAAAPAGTTAVGSLRIEATQLELLLRTTADLLAELDQADPHETALRETQAGIEDIQAEGIRLRQNLGATFHQLASHPQLGGLVAYCNLVDHRLQSLAQQGRALQNRHRARARALRALSVRLERQSLDLQSVPAGLLFDGFAPMVRDLARSQRKTVDYEAIGLHTRVDRRILQELKDPLMHLLRNAVDHGVESAAERTQAGKPSAARITLRVELAGSRVRIEVADDGRGIDPRRVADAAVRLGRITPAQAAAFTADDALKLVFEPHFSTAAEVSELSGRGIGLSTVTEALRRLRGKIEVQSTPSARTIFVLIAPSAASLHRLLLARWQDARFAFPFEDIAGVCRVRPDQLRQVDGRTALARQDRLFPLTSLGALLQMPEPALQRREEAIPVVLLRTPADVCALAVEEILGERETLIEPLPGPLRDVPAFLGGVRLDDGRIALVLDATALGASPRPAVPLELAAPNAAAAPRPRRILVVDDSFTARTLEAGILEASGYEVLLAVDGVDALRLLRRDRPDLLLADIQMPRLDGLGLLEEIKHDPTLRDLPVVLVSSVEDPAVQKRGLELGAAAYVIKRNFEHQQLLEIVQQLL